VIKVGLSARDKWGAIEELVDVLISARRIQAADRSQVIEAVGIRERSFSTGLSHGVAMPHGNAPCVGEIVAAVGTSAHGIPFDSGDGERARLVVLLVLPAEKSHRHVRTFARLNRLAARAELREKVLTARSATELAAAIHSLNLE